MKARGNTKIIIQKVSEIQNLVGEAKALQEDDQNQFGRENAKKKLDEVFELCLEIRSMYDPIN